MKIPTLRKEISGNTMFPAWYGYAWRRWDCDLIVCYPMPLNVIFAWARAIATCVRYGARAVPADPRDAYAQGRRDGKRAAND